MMDKNELMEIYDILYESFISKDNEFNNEENQNILEKYIDEENLDHDDPIRKEILKILLN